MRDRSLRIWAPTASVVAIAFGIALYAMVSSDAVVCRASLQEIPEPAGWRAWPTLPDHGGYRIQGDRGSCVGHGILCGLTNTELRDDSLCPRSGVSLDPWFNGSVGQGESDITLRESNGKLVASGHDARAGGITTEHDTFLVAFRRDAGSRRIAFQHPWMMVLSLIVAGLIGLLVVALARARRWLVRAASYRDEKRYKRGRRDESGLIVFDDGSASMASAGGPGPVLVRILGSTQGSYRTAPRTTADEIVEGELQTLCEQSHVRALDTIRLTSVVALVIGVSLLVITVGAVAISEISLD